MTSYLVAILFIVNSYVSRSGYSGDQIVAMAPQSCDSNIYALTRVDTCDGFKIMAKYFQINRNFSAQYFGSSVIVASVMTAECINNRVMVGCFPGRMWEL